MGWNFVGRTHDEIVSFRQEWQDQITHDGQVVADSQAVTGGRFGAVTGDHPPPIPRPCCRTCVSGSAADADGLKGVRVASG